MKSTFFIAILVMGHLSVTAQSTKLFDIVHINIKDTTLRKTEKDFIRKTLHFFEDENYIVRKTCSGEWGGTIVFKSKKTGVEYACGATCPVVVNKIDRRYVVSSSLNHLSGICRVVQIDHPDSMQIYEPFKPKQKTRKGQVIIRSAGDDESRSSKGTIALAGTLGMTIIVSFPYEGQLYHVTSDYRQTYLSKIENGKFVHLDTICDKSLWTYDDTVIQTVDGHYIVFFHNHVTQGYLNISGAKIEVNTYL
ncbi:hypothetical protein HGH92_27710 [Chitinophaga varians]|uniref:Uncharacterized protein n=1 Tax=Chitinophaga varians TaxID=2202339 RepID=A0A847S191_9BACT|nr:hypothetical protein [Chitinophaga varians]NLR68124.1 hypothetical protein [Chitinophaga varians]